MVTGATGIKDVGRAMSHLMGHCSTVLTRTLAEGRLVGLFERDGLSPQCPLVLLFLPDQRVGVCHSELVVHALHGLVR